MKLIRNTTVYTMNQDHDIIENCDILVSNGKIKKIGVNLPVNSDIEIMDAQGLIVTPGLIDIHTHVGVFGEGTYSGDDGNDNYSPVTPLLNAVDSVNPNHFSFADARSGGVTTVQTGAGSSNPVGGVWSIIKTVGNNVDNMVLHSRSGLKSALGENPKNRHGRINQQSPSTRMAIANYIRKYFLEAKYMIEKNKDCIENLYKSGNERLFPFIEVLKRKMPWRVHAHRADDIMTAIRIAKEFNIDLSIEHATEGYRVNKLIKKAGYPVTVGPFMLNPGKNETMNLKIENTQILSDEGILVAIITDHPVTPIQYLSVAAAVAVKHGMNEIDALKAITINPAIIGGVDDRVGSIETNKDADLVLWTEHPFNTNAKVVRTMINGDYVYKDIL